MLKQLNLQRQVQTSTDIVRTATKTAYNKVIVHLTYYNVIHISGYVSEHQLAKHLFMWERHGRQHYTYSCGHM